MIKENDKKLLIELRKNARESLTTISKRTSIPVSTLFDMLKGHQSKLIIQKQTTLLNFEKLGYNYKANFTIKAPKETREELGNYLKLHPCVNNLYRINDGYDYLAEAIFDNPKTMQDFLDNISDTFALINVQKHIVLEDIKRETFMSDHNILPLIENNLLLKKE
jgi:DNA-binding Lrp family transcriptional regulator